MVKLNMEHSGPGCNSGLRDFLASYGSGELGCSARGSVGVSQDPLAPPDGPPAETMAPSPALYPEDLNFWLAGWEGKQSRQGFAQSAQNHHAKESITEGAAPPLPGGLDVCTEELPREGQLLPGSPKRRERGLGDATQALFQASICQAQMCILDLQGEIDRKDTEPPKSFSLSPNQKVQGLPWVQDSAFSHKPLLLDTDSGEEEEEEESFGRQEEEEGLSLEEEEEEMEGLFYDNPLFQESPGPARSTGFGEPALGGQHAGRPLSLRDGTHGNSLFSRDQGDDLVCQATVPRNPQASDPPPAGTPGPFLSNLPQYRSLSPLVITEGELDASQQEVEGEQGLKFQAQECFPAQPVPSLSRSVSESPDAGAGPPVQGLLFSTCSTSLVSALLQEVPECHATQLPTPSPREDGRTLPHISPVPSPLAVERGPWCKEPEPQTSFCSSQSPSCAWVKELRGTSCLQEGSCAHDLHPASLSGPGRKLQEDSVEGFVVAELPAEAAKGSGRDKEEEEEEEEKEEGPAVQQWQGAQGRPFVSTPIGSVGRSDFPYRRSVQLGFLTGHLAIHFDLSILAETASQHPSSCQGVLSTASWAQLWLMGQAQEDLLPDETKTDGSLGCPQGLSEDPGCMALDTGAKEQAQTEGNPLFVNGMSEDQAAALRLATHLYHLDGFKRSQVAAFLRKNNEFSQMVAEAYLSFFHFQGQVLDQALRSFLKAFVLTGETQERERILQHFSQRYYSCNPEAFLSPEKKVGRSMSCQAFLNNLDGLNDGQNFPKELVKGLYHSIRQEKLQWAMCNLASKKSLEARLSLAPIFRAFLASKRGRALFCRDEEEAFSTPTRIRAPSASSQKKSNPFLMLLHDSGTQMYRQGPLARKVHAEADGKKRSSTLCLGGLMDCTQPNAHFVLRPVASLLPVLARQLHVCEGGAHSLLFASVVPPPQDENWTEALEEPIVVLHALAERASKYTKRPHVFRLQTADWSIFLFQAQTAEEMSSWISHINLVAAMFSSPPFPEAVGSQRKFTRPILPTAPCKNSLEDQYQAHEGYMDKASDDLRELQRNLPDKRSRGRDLEEYQLRKEYLLYEKRRYEAYLRLLEVKLSCAATTSSEDPDQWAAHLREAAEVGGCPGLQKSHSSPSLNMEGLPTAPAGVKVKRNISERRTVRKIITRRNKHLL
ncbi:hypothetical protein JD844_030878 [Phrynosoma platyrhinos]|uniref:Pleckstrin and Sec7 domain containing 4 n=1 Tax=Phrynosoma platyrhinos TaxID=52577 RepID=A0ABQ7T0C1_PHRPL|nr:hypothetical protein JD844_030878 [Phrynosoma platyrhinos]